MIGVPTYDNTVWTLSFKCTTAVNCLRRNSPLNYSRKFYDTSVETEGKTFSERLKNIADDEAGIGPHVLNPPTTVDALVYQTRAASLLPFVFQALWTDAVLMKFDYFVMLHADMAVPLENQGWLDEFIELFEGTKGCELLSVTAAIKKDGLYELNAAVDTPTSFDPRRITHLESARLPKVFNYKDVQELMGVPVDNLLVNTGLWIARPSAKWAKSIHFAIKAWTDWTTRPGTGVVHVEPEDWGLSRQLANLGFREGVYATTAIETLHRGTKSWSNQLSPEEKAWLEKREESQLRRAA